MYEHSFERLSSICLGIYRSSSVSVGSLATGSTSADSVRQESKIFVFKSYVVTNMYFVVRPTIVVSVLNM